MNPAYELCIQRLEPSRSAPATLVLETTSGDHRLLVPLQQPEADVFGAECAGVLTLRARMGLALTLVLDVLAVRFPAIHLRRGLQGGLEAHLVLERAGEPLAVALNPADALALARLRGLPILGDESLEPWLQPVAGAPAALSPPIVAFLAALAPDSAGDAAPPG